MDTSNYDLLSLVYEICGAYVFPASLLLITNYNVKMILTLLHFKDDVQTGAVTGVSGFLKPIWLLYTKSYDRFLTWFTAHRETFGCFFCLFVFNVIIFLRKNQVILNIYISHYILLQSRVWTSVFGDPLLLLVPWTNLFVSGITRQSKELFLFVITFCFFIYCV